MNSDSENDQAPVNRLPLDLWVYEDEEAASKHNPQLYKQTCSEIKNAMKEILQLKMNKTTRLEIDEKRIEICLQFIPLRTLNRSDKLQTKARSDAVTEAKHQTDELNVKLQNLLYEKLQLQRQIDECSASADFKSKNEEIELVAMEEFYRKAPLDVDKVEMIKHDGHQLMLERLGWELKERKQLFGESVDANLKKEKLCSQIEMLRKDLSELEAEYLSSVKRLKPLQKTLDRGIRN